MKKTMAPVVLFIGLIVGSACLMVMDRRGPGGYPPVDEFYHTDVFPSGGTLSLRSFDGNIEISGWDEEQLELYAEKLIPLPEEATVVFWGQDWRNRTPRIEYDAFEDFVKIDTRCPDPEGKDCVVDYYLSVPHAVKLRDIIARDGDVIIRDLYGEILVDLRSGRIEADNISGSFTAFVDQGSIGATMYDLRSEDEVRLTVRQGDITLYLEPAVDAAIEASAPEGEIFSEFEEAKPGEDGRLSETLGEGGASISLSALQGDINLRKIVDTEADRKEVGDGRGWERE